MPVEVVPRDTVDLSVWTDIDLDAEVPCEWLGHRGEPSSAEWIRLDATAACGCKAAQHLLMCDPCKVRMCNEDAFVCSDCGVILQQEDVHYRFVKI